MTAIKHWVMMDGLAGAGKSTLAGTLVRKLRAAGDRADLFGEEELFTREEFADVAHGFRTKEFAGPAAFEAAYSAYLSRLGGGWAVFDWSAAAMTGDLGWDRVAYVEHLRRVLHLDPGCSLILLSLRLPARVATERAAAQRGDEWLSRYDMMSVSEGYEGADQIERITARAEYHITLVEAERAAAREAGWTIVEIDASQAANLVCPAGFRRNSSILKLAPINVRNVGLYLQDRREKRGNGGNEGNEENRGTRWRVAWHGIPDSAAREG